MSYGNTKVYFDGSHYIAIPYVPNPRGSKIKSKGENEPKPDVKKKEKEIENKNNKVEKVEVEINENEPNNKEKSGYMAENNAKIDKKEIFERLFMESVDLKKRERKKYITEKMKALFDDIESAKLYVETQFERKHRNDICRRVRLMRKVNLQEFNYFCTFTYDDKKHNEESFKKGLRTCFRNFCYRQDWKYIGAWERSPEKHRLHFHGVFYIPDGQMVGELQEVADYSVVQKKVQFTVQNTYFNERFGRSDFRAITDKTVLGEAIAYLIKYIEKTGEKLVYSKGLPQYFISDIMDEDVVCPIGMEDRKLLLFDDFNCFDEGELIGKVSKETIKKMRKVN